MLSTPEGEAGLATSMGVVSNLSFFILPSKLTRAGCFLFALVSAASPSRTSDLKYASHSRPVRPGMFMEKRPHAPSGG
jgi:hypothetical protein